jgi:hypothetical protein
MRFILNFFFFGILFYLIWMFFPEAFMTLVGWANQVVMFFKDLFLGISDKVQHHVSQPAPAPAPAASWLLLSLFRGR